VIAVIAEVEEVGLDGHCNWWGRWMDDTTIAGDAMQLTTGGDHILDDATAANATS
jgi:hypothetical protein